MKGLDENKTGHVIARELRLQYGDQAPCETTIYDWIFMLKPSCECKSSPSVERRIRSSRALEMREFIKSQVELNKTVTEIFNQLVRMFGRNAFSIRTVQKWTRRYRVQSSIANRNTCEKTRHLDAENVDLATSSAQPSLSTHCNNLDNSFSVHIETFERATQPTEIRMIRVGSI